MAARVPNETRRILCPSARRSPEVPAPCRTASFWHPREGGQIFLRVDAD